jgi:type 1 fimbria pilin
MNIKDEKTAKKTPACASVGYEDLEIFFSNFFSSDIEQTSSVRKTSFTIGLVVCQGTLMSTKRTRMSLGCGDSLHSSMVALHLEEG